MKFLKCVLLAFAFVSSFAVAGVPDRTLPLNEVTIEYISIEGRIQSLQFQKVCIDGPAYILAVDSTGVNGISPSFKDGKPEQRELKKTDGKK